MKHICYRMTGTDKAPVGDGDTKSWFEYYKWNAEGEQYVPVKYPFFEGVEPGDFIWFHMDGFFWGGAPVVRVETPSLPVQTQEVWFDADQMLQVAVRTEPVFDVGRYLSDETGNDLLRLSRPRQKD